MNQGVRIVLKDLHVAFHGKKVLDSISTTIGAGQYTAVIGPNGAGKTTLLKSILGVLPFQGEVFFEKEGKRVQPVLGYIPQRVDIDRASTVSVADFLCCGLQRRPLFAGITRSSIEQAESLLSQVGAAKLLRKSLAALSGGEMQRVLTARALSRNPDVLLCDEPTSNIDLSGEELFCDLLDDLRKKRALTLVMISHDLSVVSHHADEILCLNRQLVCQGSVTDVITTETIKKLYGVHMGFHRHG